MTVSVSEFKDNIAIPLQRTIEQHKSPTLAQFSSRDDLTKQWDRAEGMLMALSHIENVYKTMTDIQPNNEPVVEILPPQ